MKSAAVWFFAGSSQAYRIFAADWPPGHFIWIDDILAFALKGRISCQEFDSFPARRYF